MTKPSALQVGGKKAKGRTNKATKTHKRKSMSKKMRHTKKHHKGGEGGGEERANILLDLQNDVTTQKDQKAINIVDAIKNLDIHRQTRTISLGRVDLTANFVAKIKNDKNIVINVPKDIGHFTTNGFGKSELLKKGDIYSIEMIRNDSSIQIVIKKISYSVTNKLLLEIVRYKGLKKAFMSEFSFYSSQMNEGTRTYTGSIKFDKNKKEQSNQIINSVESYLDGSLLGSVNPYDNDKEKDMQDKITAIIKKMDIKQYTEWENIKDTLGVQNRLQLLDEKYKGKITIKHEKTVETITINDNTGSKGKLLTLEEYSKSKSDRADARENAKKARSETIKNMGSRVKNMFTTSEPPKNIEDKQQ